MARSATDIIQDVINSAVVDAIVALKDASQGLPNALLRDLNAIHANTAFDDLPAAVKKAVEASVRNAFAQLRKDGYVVAEAKTVLRPNTAPRPERSGPRPDRSGPRPERSGPRPDSANRRGPGKPRPSGDRKR